MTASTAPGLRELQRWLASVTTHPDGVVGAPPGEGRRETLECMITAGPQLSALQRVQIYNDGYFARLLECLSDDYPALGYALGEETFTSLARAYIAQHPSRSRSLNAFGEKLAAFCRARSEPWAHFAADLARLEWALVEVVHEPVSEGLAPDALARIPAADWQAARLLPSAGVRLLGFDYPVNDFYQAFRDELSPAMPGRAPSATAVYRQGLTLWRMGLEPRAAVLLKQLLSGVPLAAAVATLELRSRAAGTNDDLAQRLPRWLGSWVQSGFFRGLALT